MSRHEMNPELYEMPREYRTRALPRARPAPAKPAYGYRRRALRGQAAAVPAIGALNLRALELWDAHAIKAGMAVFWLWFAAANWSHLAALAG